MVVYVRVLSFETSEKRKQRAKWLTKLRSENDHYNDGRQTLQYSNTASMSLQVHLHKGVKL